MKDPREGINVPGSQALQGSVIPELGPPKDPGSHWMQMLGWLAPDMLSQVPGGHGRAGFWLCLCELFRVPSDCTCSAICYGLGSFGRTKHACRAAVALEQLAEIRIQPKVSLGTGLAVWGVATCGKSTTLAYGATCAGGIVLISTFGSKLASVHSLDIWSAPLAYLHTEDTWLPALLIPLYTEKFAGITFKSCEWTDRIGNGDGKRGDEEGEA